MNENHKCPICGGELVSEDELYEDDVGHIMMEDLLDEKRRKKKKKKKKKRDACYYKVKARYKVWPSAYASGALVKCRKKGSKNWGTKSEGFQEVDEACWKGYHKEGMKTMFGKKYPNCVKNKKKKTEEQIMKKNQLRNVIREMVLSELNESPAKEGKGSVLYSDGKYEMYRTTDSYDEEPKGKPDYSILDDFSFGIRYAATQKNISIARGEFKGSQYFLIFDVHSTPFPTKEKLMDFLKKFIDEPELGTDEQRLKALENFLGDDSWNRPRPNSPEFLKYINNLKSNKTSLKEDVEECYECYQMGIQEDTGEIMEECYRTTRWYMVPDADEHTCNGEDEFYQVYGDFDDSAPLTEAEYRGRKVKLGKPMRGDVKKFKVFVRKPNGKVVKVNFGDKKMRIKKSNPKRRKSFRARHNCKNPGPRWKARYWSCRKW